MIPCPNCHKPVEILDKHLGTLFTCPHCNAVFFVDWNGQPELASHEIEPEEANPSEEGFSSGFESQSDFQGGSDFQSGNDFQAGGFQGDFASGESFATPSSHSQMSYEGQIPESVPEEMTPPDEPYLEAAEEIPEGSEFLSPETYQNPSVDSEYASVESSEQNSHDNSFGSHAVESSTSDYGDAQGQANEETPYDFSSTLDSIPEANPGNAMDSSDFSDVADFANSDTSAGPLSYTVIIQGLESSHLVKELREAMTDSKFNWDVTAILESIHQGSLEIRDLSPTKAFVLLSRIKYLPLKISWRQNVL